MSRQKKLEGSHGEDIAASYLKREGFRIIERNFRIRNGEIDIIAIDTSVKPLVLCFIEVKTRKSIAYGIPLEAITYSKLQALIRTAQYYAMIHPNLPELLRIDAVSVILHDDNSLQAIELVKNIG